MIQRLDTAHIPPQATAKKRLSFEEKSLIGELITTLDQANFWTLGFAAPRLIKIGNQIDHLHPLTFMRVAIGDPVLRDRLTRIFQDSIKRTAFLNGNGAGGFGHRLDEESKRGNLEPYINQFAQSLRIPHEGIQPLMQKRAWGDLFVHLCKKTAEHSQEKSQV